MAVGAGEGVGVAVGTEVGGEGDIGCNVGDLLVDPDAVTIGLGETG